MADVRLLLLGEPSSTVDAVVGRRLCRCSVRCFDTPLVLLKDELDLLALWCLEKLLLLLDVGGGSKRREENMVATWWFPTQTPKIQFKSKAR